MMDSSMNTILLVDDESVIMSTPGSTTTTTTIATHVSSTANSKSNPNDNSDRTQQHQQDYSSPMEISSSSSLLRSVVSPMDNVDVLQQIVAYIGPNQYRFVAMIHRQFHAIYQQLFSQCTKTYLNASTVGHVKLWFDERNMNIERSNDKQQQQQQQQQKLVTSLVRSATTLGNLPVLQYLRSVQLLEWDIDTCTCAAKLGHLQLLQWARSNGCPWDKYTCAQAAKYGHLDVLQWAKANRCPWYKHIVLSFANEGGFTNIIEWVAST